MAELPETKKPDFKTGVPIRDLRDGSMISGQVDGEELVLARTGDEFFAIAAHCTHYGGPLAEGLVVGDTIRCPWHHACFSLRTGAALGAPALADNACFETVRAGALVQVRGKKQAAPRAKPGRAPTSVVIAGAGAAGAA